MPRKKAQSQPAETPTESPAVVEAVDAEQPDKDVADAAEDFEGEL